MAILKIYRLWYLWHIFCQYLILRIFPVWTKRTVCVGEDVKGDRSISNDDDDDGNYDDDNDATPRTTTTTTSKRHTMIQNSQESGRSLVRSHRTARFAWALRCAHSLLYRSLTPELVKKLAMSQNGPVLPHSAMRVKAMTCLSCNADRGG